MFSGHRLRFHRFLIFLIATLLHISGSLTAETPNSRKNGSAEFSETAEIEDKMNRDTIRLEEADRLMDELTSLDVRMYTLIKTVGNEDSRKALIQQRNINRKLIYELVYASNVVFESLEQNRRELHGLQ